MREFLTGESSIKEKKEMEGRVSLIVSDVPWGVLKSKNDKNVTMRQDQVFQADIDAIADGAKRYLAEDGTYCSSIECNITRDLSDLTRKLQTP